MWVKQGLVKQGMYREQENNHLKWPDHLTAFLNVWKQDCSLMPEDIKSNKYAPDVTRKKGDLPMFESIRGRKSQIQLIQ